MDKTIIVIADDITGAAEIAGIAHRYALRTQLVVFDKDIADRQHPGDNVLQDASAGCHRTGDVLQNVSADVLVVATDTRSYSADEARAVTKAVVDMLPEDVLVFHKTDSALRGNVVAELEAFGCEAVYMPANPSKGRIIRGGVYYVGDKPIHETDFRYDPEFPAVTSNVHERFPSLTIPDATCKADVDAIVSDAIDKGLLLAGAADLFASLIEQVKGAQDCKCQREDGINQSPKTQDQKPKTENPQPTTDNLRPTTRLIVCGSTQSKALMLGLPVVEMPDDVFWEREKHWDVSLSDIEKQSEVALSAVEKQSETVQGVGRQSGAILAIGNKPVREGKEAAVYLRTVMAEACCSLLATMQPQELIIEGGATAFAIISQTPYARFEIVNEFAPGVVRMKTTPDASQKELFITLKPGSYSWGNLFRAP